MLPLDTARDKLIYALQSDSSDTILTYFLCVVLAFEEAVCHLTKQMPDEAGWIAFREIVSTGDILAYVSAPSDGETKLLRELLQAEHSVVGWYQQQWMQPQWSAEMILASVARSLRTPVTVIAEYTDFFYRRSAHQEAVQAQVYALRAMIEMLRHVQTSVQAYLARRDMLRPSL